MRRALRNVEKAVQYLPVTQLTPNPWNRTRFDPAALKELTKSIRAEGIREPLLVRLRGGSPERRRSGKAAIQIGGERKLIRVPLTASPESRRTGEPPHGSAATPQYEIASGNRRWLAAQAAGLKSVPCLIESLSDEQVAEDNITMNIQREDIPPLELARMVQDYMERFGKSQADAARSFGKSRSWVSYLMRFLHLPAEVLKVLTALNTSWGTLRLIQSLPQDLAVELAREVESEKLSTRGIAKRCRQLLFGSRSTGRYGAEPRLPDPFQKEWERVNVAMLGASSVWWEVRYANRKLPTGKTEPGWNLFVKPQTEVTPEVLAEWFTQMGKALRGAKLTALGEREAKAVRKAEKHLMNVLGPRVPPRPPRNSPAARGIDGTVPADKSPIWGTSQVRVPRTAAEKRDLEKIAVRGTPKDVYTWIYGADHFMTQSVPIASWADIGTTPEQGLKDILDGLRPPAEP